MEKITGNEPASGYGFCTADGLSHSEEKGLTIRQEFAKAAMQGLVSNHDFIKSKPEVMELDEWVASKSVFFADALITELNKTPDGK